MGERGPVSIPHARRRNKRSNSGKRIEIAAPQMPGDFDGEAAAEWRRVVPEIEGMGLLATLDRAALIRYCRGWADWCELDEKLLATGLLVKGRHVGSLVRNPLWMMRSDIEATLRELGKQFGLTPAARLRAGVKHEARNVDDGEQRRMTAIEGYRKRLEA